MAYECIKSLVSLAGCETATTKYTINQTGLSPVQIDEFMDDSYANREDFIEAMKDLAAAKLVSDVITMISPTSKAVSTLESGKIGFIRDNNTITPQAFSGAIIDIHRTQEFAKVQITSLGIFADYTGDVPILIYDLVNGTLLQTVTIAATAGVPSYTDVEFEFAMKQNRTQIGIFYATAGILPFSTPAKESGCTNCGNGYNYHNGPYMTFSGATSASPFIKSSTTNRTNTYGLLVNYTIACDNENWLCTVKDMLGLAYLYKVVEEIFAFGIKSGGQFSNQKVTNQENNVERYTHSEYLYKTELKKVLRTVALPSGRCFTCNTNTMIISQLPA